jgi:hypothetical protein
MIYACAAACADRTDVVERDPAPAVTVAVVPISVRRSNT